MIFLDGANYITTGLVFAPENLSISDYYSRGLELFYDKK